MRKVKIFKSVEDELSRLESDINAWVDSSKAHIVSITGNIAPQSKSNHVAGDGAFSASDVLIIVVYEEANA